MNKEYLYVANWKMNMSLPNGLEFCTSLLDEKNLPLEQIVICPTFTDISLLRYATQNAPVQFGAQDCSVYDQGAYTGQVSAQSLAAIACTYCIVGHSEQRALGTTNQEIALKVERLLEQQITPIICIGESSDEHQKGTTHTALQYQLEPIISLLQKWPDIVGQPIYIAYEPIWAIGTGTSAQPEYVAQVLTRCKEFVQQQVTLTNLKFLYGGSVDATMAQQLKTLTVLDGFLIGGASLDFQKFKKIVS